MDDPTPQIGTLLLHMARKSELIHARKRGLELLKVPLKEAEEKYELARKEFERVEDDVVQNKNANKWDEKELDGMSHSYSANIIAYASNLDARGIEVTTKTDLFIYYVLRKFGGYQGKLFIPKTSENLMLIAKANELGINVIETSIQELEEEDTNP